jgi:protein-S-isoprenylcysteine O-methyltransferase Ste14
MRRLWASVGSMIFLFVAPGTVAGLVPWWITKWQFRPPFLGSSFFRWAGAVLIVAGLMPLVGSFGWFAWEGLGTPAPIAPPIRLVEGGLYRHVRNPMYVAVVVMLLGQALLFADRRVLVWAAVFWLMCHLFVLLYEEPTLARTFGGAYETYRANVPRWIPRLVPWKPPAP